MDHARLRSNANIRSLYKFLDLQLQKYKKLCKKSADNQTKIEEITTIATEFIHEGLEAAICKEAYGYHMTLKEYKIFKKWYDEKCKNKKKFGKRSDYYSIHVIEETRVIESFEKSPEPQYLNKLCNILLCAFFPKIYIYGKWHKIVVCGKESFEEEKKSKKSMVIFQTYLVIIYYMLLYVI